MVSDQKLNVGEGLIMNDVNVYISVHKGGEGFPTDRTHFNVSRACILCPKQVKTGAREKPGVLAEQH